MHERSRLVQAGASRGIRARKKESLAQMKFAHSRGRYERDCRARRMIQRHKGSRRVLVGANRVIVGLSGRIVLHEGSRFVLV